MHLKLKTNQQRQIWLLTSQPSQKRIARIMFPPPSSPLPPPGEFLLKNTDGKELDTQWTCRRLTWLASFFQNISNSLPLIPPPIQRKTKQNSDINNSKHLTVCCSNNSSFQTGIYCWVHWCLSSHQGWKKWFHASVKGFFYKMAELWLPWILIAQNRFSTSLNKPRGCGTILKFTQIKRNICKKTNTKDFAF